MAFSEELTKKQEKINAFLEKSIPHSAGELKKAMDYSLLAGGKRIRPVLTMAVAEALGLSEDKVLPFALSMEMIHTYSLIHDDLPSMDNDDLRRGQPTNHIVFGEATAVLAGDALLNFAFENSLAFDFDTEKKLEILKVMASSSGVFGMIGGQVLDLEGEERRLKEDELTNMHRMKTGALIRASVSIGCIAAGYDKDYLDEYADNLGLAFQLKDDILDVTSTDMELGKNVGSDEKNEKTTFISLYGIEKTEKMLEEATKKAISSLDKVKNKEFLTEFAMYLLKRRA